MALMRRRPTLAAAGCALALLASACTTDSSSDSSSDGAAPTTTAAERSTGGPTTTTRPPTDPDGQSPVEDGIRVEVLSSQPDRASGPDARVRVTPSTDLSTEDLRVTLGETDVTAQFTVEDGALEGVVTGLIEGNNSLVVTGGDQSVTQRIRSWPLTGPMISGPQTPLLACSTDANGLGAPADDACSAPVRVTWVYLTQAGETKEFVDADSLPDDVRTVTLDGNDAPMVIRLETGVVNRSIYQIASVDPTPGGADSSQADAVWNERLVFRYGAGCATSYGQGTLDPEALDADALAEGYALASATFADGAVQCNDVVAAETTMMLKERFIEQFGAPEATIGRGTEFGAATLHLISQNYPGLLDAGLAIDPLPDVVTVTTDATDCGLLNRYYRTDAGRAISPAQRLEINGHATTRTCDAWELYAATMLDPTIACDPAIDPAELYAAGSNPGGPRCTYQDGSANQFGRDGSTGAALAPYDNIGVQYGLAAFDQGLISFDTFVALNRDIGGYDGDGLPVEERTQGDLAAIQAAYETGRVSTGVGDQPKIPIIELAMFDDDTGTVADHLRPFSLRDRLVRGGPAEAAPGLRIWTRDPAVTPTAAEASKALDVLDDWLVELGTDPGGGDRLDALARTRPEAALDSCQPTGAQEPIRATELYDDKGPCRDDYPIGASPRMVAGAPRTGDVLKCELQPVDPAGYEQTLTADQLDTLLEVFPDGVCNWERGGEGQTTPSMPDRSFGDVITPGEQA